MRGRPEQPLRVFERPEAQAVAFDAATGAVVWDAAYTIVGDGNGILAAGGVQRPNDPSNRGDFAFFGLHHAPLRG